MNGEMREKGGEGDLVRGKRVTGKEGKEGVVVVGGGSEK